jgi:hypothetical protein
VTSTTSFGVIATSCRTDPCQPMIDVARSGSLCPSSEIRRPTSSWITIAAAKVVTSQATLARGSNRPRGATVTA